ncbi:hypothetical protein JTB14_024866 [Gonioctena quinquepunctata]|nr:hypothetical protein JTB14_024866 [Gonioctena quinquepunctata]
MVPDELGKIGNNAYRSVENCNVKGIRQYLKEYCESTGIHGFRYLAEKRTLFEKILWFLLISTSFSTCGYLISRIYNKYHQSPVIVSFATKESPIYTIPFPSVTFCPMSKARRNLFNFTDVIYKVKGDDNISSENKLNGQYMSLVCEYGTELFPQNETFTDDFFQNLDEIRIPLKDLLYECKLMNNIVDCSELFVPIILDESVCYTFNMLDRSEIFSPTVFHFSNYHMIKEKSQWNPDGNYEKTSGFETYPMRALLAGADNSLQITFIQRNDDLDYLCLDDIQGFSCRGRDCQPPSSLSLFTGSSQCVFSQTWKIKVSNKLYHPRLTVNHHLVVHIIFQHAVLLHAPFEIPLLKKQYFQVPFDRAAIAVVQPRLMTTSEAVEKYSPHKRECYFTTEKKLKYFKYYSPSNCKLECLTNYTAKNCGCVNFYMPRERTTPICGNGCLACMRDAERIFNSPDIGRNLEMK